MSQQTITGENTVDEIESTEDGDRERTIKKGDMELVVREENYGGVTTFGLDFTLPTETAVTALLRFRYVQRNCTSSMWRSMFRAVMHARNRGENSVTFYESFRDSGWSTHLSKALDTSVADPERQKELDEFRELLDAV